MTAAAAVQQQCSYYEYLYVSTERCVPSALLLVSRAEPAPGDCILATEGRPARRLSVGREATSLKFNSVAIQLIDRSAAVCCHQ